MKVRALRAPAQPTRWFRNLFRRKAQPIVPPAWIRFPVNPTPPPENILHNRELYEEALYQRHFLPHPRRQNADTALCNLRRLYEAIILDWNMGIRNEIEYFFRRAHRLVHEIPDPKDKDPARYATLASIPHLLVDSFNHNVELGLHRDAPTIMTDDEVDELRARKKVFERVPYWVHTVPPLQHTLRIPQYIDADMEDMNAFEAEDDERLE